MINQSALPQTPKSYLTTLKIIHGAMIAGPAMFSLVTYLINQSTRIDFQNTADPKIYLVPALAVGTFLLGRILSVHKLAETLQMASLKEKLIAYQGISITRWAFQEAGALFGIVSYFISGNLLFLLIALVALGLLWTMRPTKEQIQTDLNLSVEQQMAFQDEDSVIS